MTVDRSSASEPMIADYGVIADCHTAALVARSGSIDWCCLPRFDSASCFASLLDPERGGHWLVAPVEPFEVTRQYVRDTLVLRTTFATATGEAVITDCFAMREGGRGDPHRQLVRIIEGVTGEVEFEISLVPRLDYASVRPWLRNHGVDGWTFLGGDQGLHVVGDVDLRGGDDHDLVGRVTVAAGDRARLAMSFVHPERVDPAPPAAPRAGVLDRRVDETVDWWRTWSARIGTGFDGDRPAVVRSAIVLKAMTHAPTGAIVAAVTTSLPEAPGGSRNWDYRYSWVRDSVWSARALVELGCDDVADGFRRFIERAAAGSTEELRIMYGVGGERRLTELELDGLAGFGGARPVRIGNGADDQIQHDVYGELLDLAWRWAELGHAPDDDYWRFICELADTAALVWSEPDRGIWEWRGEPKHFVHSKVMCWVALDRAIRLAEHTGRKAPTARWARRRNEIRADIFERGIDASRGCFVQAYGSPEVDATLLRLPLVGFIDVADAAMAATVDAVMDDLAEGAFVWRYRSDDGLPGREGAFLACSFWLVECLVGLGRLDEAASVFEGACAAANDLGLFSEEFDPPSGQLLGNFPQALTHLSHVAAALTLDVARQRTVQR